ncbi:MAG: gas vesicle structural protein GvpA [Chloroflexi bacterium]|nr:gas vesicle structural protein GvpA [Chloroflexota bacterium]
MPSHYHAHQSPRSSKLENPSVIDRVLDKGLVIDAWVRLSLVGIELLAVEARVVVAGVETYLKYAEAIGLTPTIAAPAR